jgi:signal transduction histidine kinase/integral membrane sensor domain MASE1
MMAIVRYLAQVALVAAAYLAAGKLGLALAIPPGYASPVWPAAGVALAALLLGGLRLWPGVLIGALAVYASMALDAAPGTAAMSSLAVAAGLAGSATLQALTGAWLVLRRVVRFPSPLLREREVAGLFLLGGPLAALIDAVAGPLVLYGAGMVAAGDLLLTAWTWLVGDTIGVLVFTPLVLCAIAQPRAVWGRRIVTVAAPLAAMFVVMVTWFGYASHLESGEQRAALAAVSEPQYAQYREPRADVASGIVGRLQSAATNSLGAKRGRPSGFAARAYALTDDYAATPRSWGPWTALAGGLLFSGLLGIVLLLQSGRTAAVAQTVAERTAALTDEIAARERAEGLLRQTHEALERQAADEARLRQDAEAYAEELKRSNADLEQFAYVASHDLQEPLRAMTGCIQLLERRNRDRFDDSSRELVDHAVGAAGRMRQLIDDLLVYSRVNSRARQPEHVDTEELVMRLLAEQALAIAERRAQVTVGELPAVVADPTQLHQVFQNLISNALKFCDAEVPHIAIGAERRGGEWVFAVTDNGIGIEPQYFERIFAAFQRLHTREEYPGSGIGLAVCKKVIERHGGRVWVESTVGQGSTFYFSLPATEIAATEARAQVRA